MPHRTPDLHRTKVFDDAATSHGVGRLALAFCLGSVAAMLALHQQKVRRRASGPADGAPLMRAPLQVVAPVDIKRYAGLWHEQARLPNRYEKACAGAISAEYTPLIDGSIEVRNRCVREDGQIDEVVGEARLARVAGLPGAGRLKVNFAPGWLSWLPIVWADYWILKLDRDYSVALVGTPDRQNLWVLSRTPRLDESTLQAELEYARSLGFDVDRVIRSGALSS